MMITSFFFFYDTSTTEIYPLSLHDSLPICEAHVSDDGTMEALDAGVVFPDVVRGPERAERLAPCRQLPDEIGEVTVVRIPADRKSTRLNSSHLVISYAVF